MNEKLPKKEPYFPAEYEVADVMAVKALAAGDATPEQQRRALQWVVETACCTYDLSYRPVSDRDTAFAEGKRYVGLQIVKLIKLSTEILRKTSHETL